MAADGGQAFGTGGLPQGDARFGDIRVGALPMAASALAEATPPDPTLAGALAGDISLNANATFTAESLYGVTLHEVGHAFGIGSSDDPTSVMYDTFNHNLSLSASDVAAVRALYGARPADSNEGSTGNGSTRNSTRIQFSSEFDGSTPLAIFGDVTTPTDADVFYLPALDTYSGPMTVRLQTAGLSLLAPTLTVSEKSGNVLAAASGGRHAGGHTLCHPAAGGRRRPVRAGGPVRRAEPDAGRCGRVRTHLALAVEHLQRLHQPAEVVLLAIVHHLHRPAADQLRLPVGGADKHHPPLGADVHRGDRIRFDQPTLLAGGDRGPVVGEHVGEQRVHLGTEHHSASAGGS